MNEQLKDKILERLPPYPTNNDGEKNNDKELGYHECVDNLIKVLDTLIAE